MYPTCINKATSLLPHVNKSLCKSIDGFIIKLPLNTGTKPVNESRINMLAIQSLMKIENVKGPGSTRHHLAVILRCLLQQAG